MKCPCCSGNSYSECCKPHHNGTPAPTPLALMRSRYSAYAEGKVDYILETTHPESPYFEQDRKKWRAAVFEFCKNTQFLKLEIIDAKDDFVHFIAHLKQKAPFLLEEKSLFQKLEEKWLYAKRLD